MVKTSASQSTSHMFNSWLWHYTTDTQTNKHAHRHTDKHVTEVHTTGWHSSAMVQTSDSQSTGHMFNSWLWHYYVSYNIG